MRLRTALACGLVFAACKTPRTDQQQSELRQINATQQEANLAYLVDGIYRSTYCSFKEKVSRDLAAKSLEWRPEAWGVKPDVFSVTAFNDNYTSRKALFTGGIWGAFVNRLEAPSTLFTDTHDEMTFTWQDGSERSQVVGLTADLKPYAATSAADDLTDPATRHVWTLEIATHTIWLTSENGTATFDKLSCGVTFDVNGDQMLIPGTGKLYDGVFYDGRQKPKSF